MSLSQEISTLATLNSIQKGTSPADVQASSSNSKFNEVLTQSQVNLQTKQLAQSLVESSLKSHQLIQQINQNKLIPITPQQLTQITTTINEIKGIYGKESLVQLDNINLLKKYDKKSTLSEPQKSLFTSSTDLLTFLPNIQNLSTENQTKVEAKLTTLNTFFDKLGLFLDKNQSVSTNFNKLNTSNLFTNNQLLSNPELLFAQMQQSMLNSISSILDDDTNTDTTSFSSLASPSQTTTASTNPLESSLSYYLAQTGQQLPSDLGKTL